MVGPVEAFKKVEEQIEAITKALLKEMLSRRFFVPFMQDTGSKQASF